MKPRHLLAVQRVISLALALGAVGAIGGVPYQPTDFIEAPSLPMDVDVTAVSSVTSVIGPPKPEIRQ